MIEKQRTILIVDDFEDVRESLAQILGDEGYTIFQASNGLEAIEVMTAGQIDLLITDILMPEMDGIELSTIARNQFPDLKMILISGGGRQGLLSGEYDYLGMTAKLTNIDHVLKKPFDPLEIIELVNRLINK